MSEIADNQDLTPKVKAEPIPTGSAQSLSERTTEPEYLGNAKRVTDNDQREMMIAGSFMRHHSGPLPDPDTLAAYEKILPGAAERIFLRFEKQSDHRMDMESKVIGSNTFSQRWSTVLASLVALLVASGALFLTHEGRSVAGLAVFFGTLFSFLATYALGKKLQGDERRARLETGSDADDENSQLESGHEAPIVPTPSRPS